MSKKLLSLTIIMMITSMLFSACQTTPEATEAPTKPPTEPPTDVVEEPVMDFTGEELTISHWGYNMEDIEEAYLNSFMEEYGVTLVHELGNNADRLAKIEARAGDPVVDVVQLSLDFAIRAKKLGLLQPIDVSKLSSYDELYDWAKDMAGDDYCIGYGVSSGPLIYRTDLVDPPPTSWNDLLREDLAGHISFPDLPTAFGMAAFRARRSS